MSRFNSWVLHSILAGMCCAVLLERLIQRAGCGFRAVFGQVGLQVGGIIAEAAANLPNPKSLTLALAI